MDAAVAALTSRRSAFPAGFFTLFLLVVTLGCATLFQAAPDLEQQIHESPPVQERVNVTNADKSATKIFCIPRQP
jgi:hypothetical protein